MSEPVKIPFGYKQVFGQLQKGDGILDLATGGFKQVRRVPTEVIIRKTKKLYPCAMQTSGVVAIRRCEVTQAGARLFRAAPHPDIQFRHASKEAAESDATKLRAYIGATWPMKGPSKAKLRKQHD